MSSRAKSTWCSDALTLRSISGWASAKRPSRWTSHFAAKFGEVLTVTKAIEDGRGRAKVGDGEWPVRGPDVAEGAKVRVVSADGGVLVVELA